MRGGRGQNVAGRGQPPCRYWAALREPTMNLGDRMDDFEGYKVPATSEEWGVHFAGTGEIVVCDTEAAARLMAGKRDGTLMKREVFETS